MISFCSVLPKRQHGVENGLCFDCMCRHHACGHDEQQHTIFMNNMSCMFVHSFRLLSLYVFWNNSLHLTQHIFFPFYTVIHFCSLFFRMKMWTYFDQKGQNGRFCCAKTFFAKQKKTMSTLDNVGNVWKLLGNNKVIRPERQNVKRRQYFFFVNVCKCVCVRERMYVHFTANCWPTLWHNITRKLRLKKNSIHQLTWPCFFLWLTIFRFDIFFPRICWFIISFISLFQPSKLP